MTRNLQRTFRSPEYLRRLQLAWAEFSLFLFYQAGDYSVSAKTPILRINRLLVEFIQNLYEKSEGRSAAGYETAKHAVLSVQVNFPRFRGRLRQAWESVGSWGLELPGRLRTAVPLPVLLCMSILSRVMAAETSGQDAYLWLSCSVLCEVGFYGLLRPGELLRMRRGLVSLPGRATSLGGKFALIGIVSPKRREMGKTQFAMVRNVNTTLWLAWLCEGLSSYHLLWPASAFEFRKRMKLLASLLGLSHWKILPSSLRPGGATHFFSCSVDPDRMLFWGRWASLNSLKHYVQEMISAQLVQQAPAATQRDIVKLLSSGHKLLEVPQNPWWHFAARKDCPAPAGQSSNDRTLHVSSAWTSLYNPCENYGLGS